MRMWFTILILEFPFACMNRKTRYYETLVLGSQWQEYEVRHYYKKDQYPTKFWLNLDFYQQGTIWLKDIRLFGAPAKRD